MIHVVRGAIQVSENTKEAIAEAVFELISALAEKNNLSPASVLATFFTMTPDLSAENPAKACRDRLALWNDVPFFCMQEPVLESMLPRCIRVLIQWDPEQQRTSSVQHVYLGEAQHLRPDRVFD
jgi:chorismate mutase